MRWTRARGAAPLGDKFADLHVAAIGPPIHGSKDRTIVLAHGPQAMPELQDLIAVTRGENTD